MSKIWTWEEFDAWMAKVWRETATRTLQTGYPSLDIEASVLRAEELGVTLRSMDQCPNGLLQKLLEHCCDCTRCTAIKIRAYEILNERRRG